MCLPVASVTLTAPADPEYMLRALGLEDVAQPALAPQPAWSFDLAPYLWVASLSGNITIDGQEVETEDGGDGFFGDPAFGGFLGHFEAHHGPWSFAVAPIFITADLPGEGPANTDGELSIHAQVHEAFVAREFAADWDWLVGARYQSIETDMDLSLGGVPQSSLSSSRNWTDPIVGLRYHTDLDEDWFLRARGDIGGFGVGSKFVWNASVLAGYRCSSLVGLYLGYRALSFDFESGSGNERVEYDLTLYGPIIGVSFSF